MKYQFIKTNAIRKLGEYYISQDKHNRAKETFIEVEEAFTKSWLYVYEIYPKLRGELCEYDRYKNVVTFK